MPPVLYVLLLEGELLHQVHGVERPDDQLAALADDLCLGIPLELQIGLVAEDIYDLDIDTL